jgi:hypothetical protein
VSVNVIAELNPHWSIRTKLTVSPKPVADIIRELDSGFPASQARVCLNGEIVKDFSAMTRDGDTLWVKFVPYGTPGETGAGMKIGGWALAAIGLAVGFVAGWTGFGAAAAVALIGSGVGLVTGGAVLMNVNIPSLKDREKPDQDPSIRGGKNQARPHGRIPVLFGRHRLYPDLAANPHTSVTGNSQYYTQLFCGGYKDCVIDLDSLKLGETPLADLSGTKDIGQILAGADPFIQMEILQNGEPSQLYPYCVHEDAINAPLQNQTEDAEGNKIPGEITRRTPDNTDTINVDIFLYNGIGKYNNESGLVSASVEVKASYKKPADGDWLPLGFFNNNSNTLSGKELKTKRYQITSEKLTPGAYDVKIERVTEDSADSKVIDQVYVGSVRSVKSVPPIRPGRQKDLTIIALRVAATAKVQGVVDSFNYAATSKLPVYAGGGSGELYWLAAAETRNPAAVLLHALRGRAAQQRADPGDIDWPSFEAFYRWCEEHKYYCDSYLCESVTVAELLRMIGGTARADILRVDSKISVVQDIERPAHVQLFTPKNTRGYSVAMFTADIPDEIALRYIEREAGYVQTELPVYNTADGKEGEEPPETVQKVDLWGITDRAQAWLIGRYNYACLKHRPFVHTVEVDIEYLLCNKGDWIQYAGDLALTGPVQGRVTETLRSDDNRCVGVRIDEPVETEAGKEYAVRLRLSDGTVLLRDVSVTRQPGEIYFTEPLAERDAPRPGDIYAFGIRGQEVIDLIITDIQPQADLCAVLTCVEYSPAIFGVDDPGFEMPEFENKITPVSGAVDSGVAGTARWKLFVTYHDDEREPPKPSGDGQGGGWHYAHTVQALWQSSKTAETVDSGEWGPPVRIKGERGNTDTVAVYLALSPQTVILDTDAAGGIIEGLLPFTARAELFKWNYKIPGVEGIPRYPGSGSNLFDPMLGDFVPAERERDIVFSLADAPPGVTVNPDGVIAIAAGAALGDENSVTVRAEYGGETYTAVLFIQVKKRAGEDCYMGTVDTLPVPEGPEVTILKGPVQGRVRAWPGCYVLAVAAGTVGGRVWKAGYVYQWTGVRWEERDPARYADLYMRCFPDGLEAPGLAQDTGWFVNLFCGLLFAQRAFITQLQTRLITLENGGAIKSANWPDDDGFFIEGGSGDVFFGSGMFRGHIEALSGFFTGKVTANEGVLNNVTINESCTVKGKFAAAGIEITGAHAAGGAATGASNPETIAYENATITTYGNIPLGDTSPAAKKIRIAGRGTCRLRIRGAGWYSVSRLRSDGGWQQNIVSQTNMQSEGELWSEVVELPDDINIFYLFGGNITNPNTSFKNTIFEARASGKPGLLKYMSSPY